MWPAAVALARSVARLGCEGLRVLDLGCGLGVPGVAAARERASVVFADREADALAFARWNAVGNSVRKDAVACRIDWARETVPGSFDVILMADVSYRPLHHEPLRRHAETCLLRDGMLVHADPWRPESAPFLEWLRGSFSVLEESCDVVFAERRTRIRVVCAARSVSLLGRFQSAAHQNSPRRQQ
ncbi:MAG: methyltransferase [Planctomycetes bacterium]|nr:methyltransferase [Planctomycetota bacterium]